MNRATTSSSASGTAAPGTRPEGAGDEQLAARRVRSMFSAIAPRYDFLNHLLSLSLDRVWRRRLAAKLRDVLARSDSRTLDVCCGTGDLTLALLRYCRGAVYGCDFVRPMLVRAEQKTAALKKRAANTYRGSRQQGYVEADALALPFGEASMDLITLAFGFRNLANYDRGLREFARVLRPGGQLAILEFSEPRGPLFGRLYRWYFTEVLPRLGKVISGHEDAYSYLPRSVARFPTSGEMINRMRSAGFAAVHYEPWTGGVVALYRGEKPKAASHPG